MTVDVQPSEGAQVVQGNGGVQPVTTADPAATSGATEATQEQQHSSPLSPDEERRRQEQSLRDRIRHEERLRLQKEQAAQVQRETAERDRKLMLEMDDEDLGRTARQRLSQADQQRAIYEQATRVAAGIYEQTEAGVLASIKSDSVREELAKRSKDGEFATFQEFQAAADTAKEALIKAELERSFKAREKEIREAVANEQRAESLVVPQLGNGLPTAALDPHKLSAHQKMALGYKRATERNRGG